jgi:hypothetical protein
LGEAFRNIGVRAAGILPDNLNFLTGDRVAVLLHIKLDAVVDLSTRVSKLTGIGIDHADFDLGIGARRQHDGRKKGCNGE